MDGLLEALEQRLSVLQQIAEMRLRSYDVPDMSLSLLKIPEILCCVRKEHGSLIQDKYHAL